MKTKISLFLIFFLLFTRLVFSQNVFNGKILNKYNQPLVGASILIIGTSNGTTADIDGNFSLTASNNILHLEISMAGYQPIEIFLSKSKDRLTIYLREISYIDEVVKTGLGAKKMKDSPLITPKAIKKIRKRTKRNKRK